MKKVVLVLMSIMLLSGCTNDFDKEKVTESDLKVKTSAVVSRETEKEVKTHFTTKKTTTTKTITTTTTMSKSTRSTVSTKSTMVFSSSKSIVTTKKSIASSTTKRGRIVYKTPTGKKYHYDNHCNGGTYIETTLDDALSSGLEPCKKCVLN